MKKKILCYLMMFSIILSSLISPITVHASAVEVLTEAELLRQSFQVLEGGAVNSSFTGFEVIEGGLSVAEKEAMVSSFGSQILAGAKALGYNVAIAGATAVTEYTALEVGYRALDAIMDSSAGDGITELWLNTFSNCAYYGTSSLATEKAVLTSNMLGSLEDLLNHHYNGDFEINAGLVGNNVALGSDYFQNATSSGVEAYEALNTSYQATFVFNGDTSTQFMSHYFVNGASYGVISGGELTLYKASGEQCTISNSSGKVTTSFVIGTDFYGLDTYSNMTTFVITLGSVFKMISGSGIRLYEGTTDSPITQVVTSPIQVPEVPITLPNSITVPLDVDSALSIANGEEEAEIDESSNTDSDSNSDESIGILDWLSKILNAINSLPASIASAFSALWDWLSDILDAIKSLPIALSDIVIDVLQSAWEWLFVPDESITADWIAMEMDYIDSQTGVLTYPLATLIKFLNRLLDINVGDMILTMPTVSWQGAEIITETSFNMTKFLADNQELKSFYSYYLIIVKAVLIFAVINLARKKFYEMEMN